MRWGFDRVFPPSKRMLSVALNSPSVWSSPSPQHMGWRTPAGEHSRKGLIH